MASPVVSVIIPTYQRAPLIGRAVHSCLEQSCHVEVIVVDDGSTDGTEERLLRLCGQVIPGGAAEGGAGQGWTVAVTGGRGCAGKTLRYIFQANQGVCAARNRGLSEASGSHVKFLDSDDELSAGALAGELRVAEETGADVVVSAWVERAQGAAADTCVSEVRRPCPSMTRGIDDMLEGESPWTSAALYRRDFIAALRWNADFGKADDWGWAWTVCLAGARYARTDLVAAIYWHHEGARITGSDAAFRESTDMRQRILARVEDELRRSGGLTNGRKRALARYYYKDRVVLCEEATERWKRVWGHCQELAPGFRPSEPHPVMGVLVRILGPYHGVCAYVSLRRWYYRVVRIRTGMRGG